MGLRQWLNRRTGNDIDRRLRRWRDNWTQAAASSDHPDVMGLADELESFALPEDEIEIEREMLQALIEREELAARIDQSGLPRVETGHRVVRGEPCHYSEPASMPDEPAQPGGRLLLTAARAIFIGGGKPQTAAWHTITAALHSERDVVLVKHDREHSYRFRCNTYGDALRAAFIARELLHRRHG
ncbi:MAG: hypothetical protein ACJ731_11865 [Vicinamibacterales bacterium]